MVPKTWYPIGKLQTNKNNKQKIKEIKMERKLVTSIEYTRDGVRCNSVFVENKRYSDVTEASLARVFSLANNNDGKTMVTRIGNDVAKGVGISFYCKTKR
jgi:hypothetical protein